MSRVAVTALAITLLAAGCGSDREPAAASVDEKALNWGNYPTVPRDMAALADAESGAVQESIRLAEHVPLPMEIDSRLTARQSASALTPSSLPNVKGFASGAPGLVAGWQTFAQRGSDAALGLDLSVSHSIARFDSREHAVRAMNFMADTVDPEYPNQGPLTVPGYGDARAVLGFLDAVKVWLAYDDYVIWLRLSHQIAAPDGPAPLLDLAERLIDKQIELLRSYQPTPVDRLGEVPADIDGLRGRALPDDNQRLRVKSGIYSARAALHTQTDPGRSRRAFTEAGVDLVATEYATLYRTAGADEARGLAANFLAELSAKYTAADSPLGLPTAQCLRITDPESYANPHVCYLVYDRYVAEVYATQQQDLHQRVSAQYLLLAHGQ
ncbi:hypothetical protein [Nocardia sp. NPDC050406]|uniref:DUF7373 family lipoprotein n=1 Tax=Nocardia sp. NPDC050406 TaxID=3364318 RepID=UPI00379C368C